MSSETLILVHSIIRHGNRTQDALSFYPNDPHRYNKYYPYGLGMLTNEGKRSVYMTGQAFRERYNDYLGEIYIPEHLETWTTEYERCRASAKLLLASLFPPKGDQTWSNSLNWQPIPVNYSPIEKDLLLAPMLKSNKFMKMYHKNFESGYGKELLETQGDLVSYVAQHCGIKITNTLQVFVVNDALKTQEEFGLPLPEWAQSIYPEKLRDLACKDYEMQTFTKELRRYLSGQLLKKILADTQDKMTGKSRRKMHLYVGHDINIAHMFIALGLPRIYKPYPQYAAALTFEVYRIDDRCGIKVLYKKNKISDFELLHLNNGNTILWIEDFEKIVEEVGYDDDEVKETSREFAFPLQ